jgi:hypothetical protein
VRDHAVAIDLDTAVRSYLAGSRDVLGGGAGQIDSLGACLVGLFPASTSRAHVR